MKQIISRFELTQLFDTEKSPKLKLSFYTLDRLISMLLPDLHAHFKVCLPVFNHDLG